MARGRGARRSQASGGSFGQTGRKFPAAHGTRRAPRGRLRGGRGETSHRDNQERAAPARGRTAGTAGRTLPPPTGPRSPPRRGVLAAGRAGTAAGAPGPEASGRFRPWLGLGRRPRRFRPRAARALPSERSVGGARRGGATSGSLVAPPPCGLGPAWPSRGSGVLSANASCAPTRLASRCAVYIFKPMKNLLVLYPTHLLKKHFSAQKAYISRR